MAAKKKTVAVKAKSKVVGRNDQVVRILRLLRHLNRLGGCDVYELAQEYGTTTRTVWRDFDALEAAGLPLKREPGEGSRMRFSLDTTAADALTNVIEASHFLALRMAMNEGLAVKHNSSLFASLEQLYPHLDSASTGATVPAVGCRLRLI